VCKTSYSEQLGLILCQECRQLLDRFTEAVHDVIRLNEQHLHAVAENQPDAHRFDLLIHAANENKQEAKYAYMKHLENHPCPSNGCN